MVEEKLRREIRFFRGYALIMSVFAAVFLIGAIANRSASFDTIDAHLITIRDADGTIRLKIFGKNDEPEAQFDGKSFPGRSGGEDADAGLMFYSERKDEVGGLIYGAHRTDHATVEQGQSLTFDAYKQDQVVQLMHDQDGPSRTAGLIVNDRPQTPLTAMIPVFHEIDALPKAQQAAARAKLRAEGKIGATRLFAGINDGGATIALRDATGKIRLRLSVAADGTQAIQFLSAGGKVVKTIGEN